MTLDQVLTLTLPKRSLGGQYEMTINEAATTDGIKEKIHPKSAAQLAWERAAERKRQEARQERRKRRRQGQG